MGGAKLAGYYNETNMGRLLYSDHRADAIKSPSHNTIVTHILSAEKKLIKTNYHGNSCDYTEVWEAIPEIDEDSKERKMKIIDFKPCRELNEGDNKRYEDSHYF